jgi:hypothetical protein
MLSRQHTDLNIHSNHRRQNAVPWAHLPSQLSLPLLQLLLRCILLAPAGRKLLLALLQLLRQPRQPGRLLRGDRLQLSQLTSNLQGSREGDGLGTRSSHDCTCCLQGRAC